MDLNRLKIQKLDRRMSGHQNFKYRLELPVYAFNDATGPGSAWLRRTVAFNDFCRHLTSVYGFGPCVDDAHVYANHYNEVPQWAYRLVDHRHVGTIYVANEAGREELEKILAFIILKSK